MYELLFNPSYWLVALAILAGVVTVYFGLSQLRQRLTKAGWTVLILALAWATAAFLIETPRETASRGSREFVAAVVSGDSATQARWLSSEASCFHLTKEGILHAARVYVPEYGIKSATILGLESTDAGENVTVTFRCLADLAPDNKPGQKIPTDWRFTWFKYNGGLLIQHIEYLGMGNGVSSDIDRFNEQHFSQSLNTPAEAANH